MHRLSRRLLVHREGGRVARAGRRRLMKIVAPAYSIPVAPAPRRQPTGSPARPLGSSIHRSRHLHVCAPTPLTRQLPMTDGLQAVRPNAAAASRASNPHRPKTATARGCAADGADQLREREAQHLRLPTDVVWRDDVSWQATLGVEHGAAAAPLEIEAAKRDNKTAPRWARTSRTRGPGSRHTTAALTTVLRSDTVDRFARRNVSRARTSIRSVRSEIMYGNRLSPAPRVRALPLCLALLSAATARASPCLVSLDADNRSREEGAALRG